MTDLSELFAKDPLSYTRSDRDLIVKTLREKRGQFQLGNSKAGQMKLTAKQKANAEVAEKIGGLELDL